MAIFAKKNFFIRLRIFGEEIFFSKVAFAFVFLLLVLVSNSEARGDVQIQSYYYVEKISGTVLTRGPFDYSWSNVKSREKIPEGQILQTTEGAHVVLKYHPMGGDGYAKSGEFRQNIDIPIVVRLKPGILRKMSITNNFVDTLPAVAMQEQALSENALDLKTSWSKSAAILVQKILGPKFSKLLKIKENKDGLEANMKFRKIRIFTPYSPQGLHVLKLPYEFFVRWKAIPIKDAAYNIYFWPSDGERSTPIAKTRDDQYKLHVSLPGSYFLQISSQNEKWQSEVVKIEVYLESGKENLGPREQKEKKNVASELNLIYPPQSYNHRSTQENVKEYFRWSFGPMVQDLTYTWFLGDEEGKVLDKVLTSENYVGRVLKPGRYFWYVEARAKMGVQASSTLIKAQFLDSQLKPPEFESGFSKRAKFRSEVREIIVSQVQGQKRDPILDKIGKLDSNQTVFLSEGL